MKALRKNLFFGFLLLCLGWITFSQIKRELYPPEIHLSDVEWLLGTWQVNDGPDFEQWEKKNDTQFIGRNYKIVDSDTLLTEEMLLRKIETGFQYIPTAMNQNEEKSVTFTMVSKRSKKLVFENMGHDFPNIIGYYRRGEDRINTWIAGKQNGEEKMIEFKLTKIKEQ